MKNPEFDAYIETAPAYAKPIVRKIRELFHKAFPEIEEHIKWGHLSFEHKGIVGGVSAHKKHMNFVFWKGGLCKDPHKTFQVEGTSSGLVLTSMEDLPRDSIIIDYIREAVELNEKGVKSPMSKKSKAKKELVIPDYFMAALRKNKKALAVFEGFSYSHKKEYVEWITEAKQEETRARRISQAIEWMSKGKSRNWKYTNG